MRGFCLPWLVCVCVCACFYVREDMGNTSQISRRHLLKELAEPDVQVDGLFEAFLEDVFVLRLICLVGVFF